jgi:hypothetical protein
MYSEEKIEFGSGEFDVIVTGPRRSMFNRQSEIENRNSLRPYFAVPFGDMMIAGCFGLLAATGDVLPEFRETIYASLNGTGKRGVAPWDHPV